MGQEHRANNQTYIEDSSHIYWTSYPNPFSPPTINDTSSGLICEGLTFYCDLSDTVTATLIDEYSNVILSWEQFADNSHLFHICYGLAGPRILPGNLPVKNIKTVNNIHLGIQLSIGGTIKNIKSKAIYIPHGYYFWVAK